MKKMKTKNRGAEMTETFEDERILEYRAELDELDEMIQDAEAEIERIAIKIKLASWNAGHQETQKGRWLAFQEINSLKDKRQQLVLKINI